MNSDIVSELAPTGRLHATINLGNTVLAQQGAGGTLGGVSVELARALAGRIGVEAELHPFDTAGKAFAALQAGECDIGFLAIDPKRGEDLEFTRPYVFIEGTYLVPDTSPLRDIEDVDQAGVRIAAAKNTAYDLYLSRTLRHAQLVYYPTSAVAIEAALRGETDAVAGVRQPLAAAASTAGFRVMDGRFLLIEQAMAVPKGRIAARDFVEAFLSEHKQSGFVAAALARSGQSATVPE